MVDLCPVGSLEEARHRAYVMGDETTGVTAKEVERVFPGSHGKSDEQALGSALCSSCSDYDKRADSSALIAGDEEIRGNFSYGVDDLLKDT